MSTFYQLNTYTITLGDTFLSIYCQVEPKSHISYLERFEIGDWIWWKQMTDLLSLFQLTYYIIVSIYVNEHVIFFINIFNVLTKKKLKHKSVKVTFS